MNLRTINIRKGFMVILLAAGFCACKKDVTEANEVTQTPDLYISKIVHTSNAVVNGVAVPSVTPYTFTYNPNFSLLSLSIRYGTSTTDTLYNKIAVDASGRLQLFSTPKNVNALNIAYDAAGNVSSIKQTALGSAGKLNDIRNFLYSTDNQLTGSNKFIAGSTVAASVNTFVTDDNGNISGASFINGNTTTPATFKYYDAELPNPFYRLQKSAVLAFFPDQLWSNIEVIVFSKRLLKESAVGGGPAITYSYTFDRFNRITTVTATTAAGGSTSAVVDTYTISYAN